MTKVGLSQEMAQALQEKSKVKFELANHLKDQQNKQLHLENDENQRFTDQKRDNERYYAELEQTITRANTEQQEAMKVAESLKSVMTTEALQKKSVLIT